MRTSCLRAAALLRASAITDVPGWCRSMSGAPQQLATIKSLRERSGAPIADVKSALQEASWDMDAAFEVLRKKGLAAATKKAGRHAAEGLVGLSQQGTRVAIVEINSETDFAARNPQFLQLVGTVAVAALQLPTDAQHCIDQDALHAHTLPSGTSVQDAVIEFASTVRENIKLRRGVAIEGPVVGTYLHTSPAPGVARMAAAVTLDGQGLLPGSAPAAVVELAHKLSMHAVAARPAYLNKEDVPQDVLHAEREILREQAQKSGKSANVIEKMVEGRLSKFYEEQCLLQQKYVLDDKQSVQDVIKAIGQQAGIADLRVGGFVRLQCGEGLEKKQANFAEEVAAAAGV